MSQYGQGYNRVRSFGRKVKGVVLPEGGKLDWLENEYTVGPVKQTRYYSYPEKKPEEASKQSEPEASLSKLVNDSSEDLPEWYIEYRGNGVVVKRLS